MGEDRAGDDRAGADWADDDRAGDGWADDSGLARLPSGVRVRGRRLADTASPADFALVLAEGPLPAWPHRRIRWPDFWIPTDTADALDALVEAYRRANRGDRVEVACRGGVGRTGTALAALAVLDGLAPREAVRWVRGTYNRRAVETPWQRRWLVKVAGLLNTRSRDG
jgi:Protein-tyrosine phosphatase